MKSPVEQLIHKIPMYMKIKYCSQSENDKDILYIRLEMLWGKKD